MTTQDNQDAERAALLPCPFCQSAAVAGTLPDNGINFAGCSDEDCIGRMAAYDFVDVEHAIAAWNRRASTPAEVGATSGSIEDYAQFHTLLGSWMSMRDYYEDDGKPEVIEAWRKLIDYIDLRAALSRQSATATEASGEPAPPFAAPAGQHDALAWELTNEDIDMVWQSMPGGPSHWLKGFGYQNFARAIEAELATRFRAEGGDTSKGSTESATTVGVEPVYQVDLENGGCWMDIPEGEVEGWTRRKFKVRTLYAAPAHTAAPIAEKLNAALQWLNTAQHGDNCFVSDHYEGDPGNRCNCGLDSLIDYLESEGAHPVERAEAPALEHDHSEGGHVD